MFVNMQSEPTSMGIGRSSYSLLKSIQSIMVDSEPKTDSPYTESSVRFFIIFSHCLFKVNQ